MTGHWFDSGMPHSMSVYSESSVTFVYTKSGTRYLLDKQQMTIRAAQRMFKLVEWPSITVGEPMHVVYRKDGEFEKRELKTSEVIGIV